jgi:hypothetical protein
MRSTGIALIVFSATLAAGCHKRVVVPPAASLPVPPLPSPVSSPPPAPRPAPPPPPIVPPDAVSIAPPLLDGDRAFYSENYDEAARLYESYLRNNPSGEQRDQAHYYLGLTYASRPLPDWPRAVSNFRQLVDEYPKSEFRAVAHLILTLRSDLDQSAADTRQRDQRIRQLTTELDRLKKIDADRRKRP